MKNTTWYDRHKGPFTLFAVNAEDVKRCVAERLTSGREVEEVAEAFATDPRDDVDRIYVWSETEQQYAITLPFNEGQRKEWLARRLQAQKDAGVVPKVVEKKVRRRGKGRKM